VYMVVFATRSWRQNHILARRGERRPEGRGRFAVRVENLSMSASQMSLWWEESVLVQR
jgi:hypothetical protein